MSKVKFTNETKELVRDLDGRELPIALKLSHNIFGLIIGHYVKADLNYMVVDPNDGKIFPQISCENIPQLVTKLNSLYPSWRVVKGEIKFTE